MTDDKGEIYKNKLTLVKELAEKLGEKEVVVQCPVCGVPHEKVQVNELSLEVIEQPCSEECRKKLERYNLPVGIFV